MYLKTSLRPARASRESNRRGAINMEYVFGGALAVVILASVGLAVWVGMGGGKKEDSYALKDKTYICDACGEQFTVTPDEMTDAEKNISPMSPKVIKCRKCGKNAAYQAVPCPVCEKVYVPLRARDPLSPERDICPFCETDVDAYKKKKRAEARR